MSPAVFTSAVGGAPAPAGVVGSDCAVGAPGIWPPQAASPATNTATHAACVALR
jgi:hypothetical protein